MKDRPCTEYLISPIYLYRTKIRERGIEGRIVLKDLRPCLKRKTHEARARNGLSLPRELSTSRGLQNSKYLRYVKNNKNWKLSFSVSRLLLLNEISRRSDSRIVPLSTLASRSWK